MIQDHARFAAYIAISYILFIFSGILLHFINTHDFYTLKFSLNLPSTWIAAFVSVSGLATLGLVSGKHSY